MVAVPIQREQSGQSLGDVKTRISILRTRKVEDMVYRENIRSRKGGQGPDHEEFGSPC